jgi:hypothetical protein
MASSLKEAQKGLETIEEHIGIVGNPTEYQTVNKSDSLKKMRDSRDLPKDGARQAFRSHDTRLENLDAARLDDTEKDIIQQRQRNIRIAEKLYIERQYKALGIEPREQGQPRAFTQADYEKHAAKFLAQLEAKGMTPKNLAAIREGINKGIIEKTKTHTTEKPTTPRKLASRDEPEIER